jgi:hypothetical protein
MEYLEQLAREWYEYQGYFVRTDLWVGFQPDGSYECELDVVAFHPLRRHIVHIEPSFDLLTTEEHEQHFRLKFEAGRKYLHRLFGVGPGHELEQVALIESSDQRHLATIAGGRVILLPDFLTQILAALAPLDPASSLVPEQWPLVRTLHFVSRMGLPRESVNARISARAAAAHATYSNTSQDPSS